MPSVLKRSARRRGGFPFPWRAIRLPSIFPVNDRSLALMDTLDRITLDHGGRFYLAKDARNASARVIEAADDPRERFPRDAGGDGRGGAPASSRCNPKGLGL